MANPIARNSSPPDHDRVPILPNSDNTELDDFSAEHGEQPAEAKQPAGELRADSFPPANMPSAPSGFASHQGSAVVGILPTDTHKVQTTQVAVMQAQHVQRPVFLNLAPPPQDYSWASILTCLFCFWPLGLVAIFFSCKSCREAEVGDHITARWSGQMALRLSLASLIIGLILLTIIGLLAAIN